MNYDLTTGTIAALFRASGLTFWLCSFITFYLVCLSLSYLIFASPDYLSRSPLLCQENRIPLQSSSYNYKIRQYHSISAFIYKFKILQLLKHQEKLFYTTDTVHGGVLYKMYSSSSWSVWLHPHNNTKAKSSTMHTYNYALSPDIIQYGHSLFSWIDL